MAKKQRERAKIESANEEVLSSIGNPNPWTPESEEAWLKQPRRELERRFRPLAKPRHIRYVHRPKGA